MRILIVLAVGLSLFAAAPAMAQDGDAARRMVLARQYLELTQGPNLTKTVQSYFEEAFAKSDAPAEERDWLTENMASAFEIAIQATFSELIDDVADIYTLEELEALVGFFDTPLGRSVSIKSFELGVRTQAAMMPHLTAAMTQLGEKYCARFDCSATEGAQAGKPAD